ncbi:MAG: hypothetical protein KAV82_05160 [Phycisphaerae bacterium]|nr:hypothetical protein [Phycisphaerae bacterium]
MKTTIAKASFFCLTILLTLICTGCDSAGVWDIVLGSLRLTEGIVGVAT